MIRKGYTVNVLSPLPATEPALHCAVWHFGDFVLDLPRYELRRNGIPVKVEPQVFDVLTQLVAHHHRVVTKNELFDTVWGGRFVGEAALTSRIKAVRRALGDDGGSQHYIRTVRGRGYQFVGVLREPEADERAGAAGSDDLPAEKVPEPSFAPAHRVLYFRPRRARGHGRGRYRVAPSTRRREFNGPPR